MQRVARVMIALATACWGPAEAVADRIGPEEDSVRLFFVYSDSDPAHRDQVASLLEFVARWQGRVQLTGIVRDGVDEGDDADVPGGVSFRLVGVAAAGADPGIPRTLTAAFDAANEFVIYSGGMEEPVTVREAVEMRDLVSRLIVVGAATDIQENTWGKIKIFFN